MLDDPEFTRQMEATDEIMRRRRAALRELRRPDRKPVRPLADTNPTAFQAEGRS
jgi:hypothetical protein